MAFRLFIEFDGLCAFVPGQYRDRMNVILVNGAASSPVYGHQQGHMHAPAHYPFVRFKRRDLVWPANLGPRFIRRGAAVIRFVDWEEIRVVSGTPPTRPLVIAGGRRPGSAEPLFKNGDQHDFSWLVEMKRIDSALEIDPICLDLDPPRNRVLGRVFLDSGEIRTASLAVRSPGQPFLWEFRDMNHGSVSPICQALASKIVYEISVPDSYVTLRFSRFRGDAPSELRFAPNGSDSVSIMIANLPLEAILGLQGGGYMIDDMRQHFSLLYRVAKGRPEHLYLPYVVPHPGLSNQELPRAGTTLCIGGSYSG